MMTDVLLVILPVLFVGSIFSVVAGGGLGIILVITFTMFFDVRESVVFMSLIGLILQPAKALYFAKFANWRIFRWYVLFGLPCSYLGGLLLFSMPQDAIRIAIAVICLLFVTLRVSHRKFSITPTNRNVLICGAINGFQGGIVGVGNFLRNPFLLSFGLKKEQFLGTASILSIVLNFGKITAYLPNISWTRDIQIMLLSSVLPVFAGVYVGRRLLTHLSKETFERLLLFVILAGAVKLLLFP